MSNPRSTISTKELPHFPLPVILLHAGATPIDGVSDGKPNTDITPYTAPGIAGDLICAAGGGSPFACSHRTSEKKSIDDAVNVIIQDNEYPIVLIADGASGCESEPIKQIINHPKIQALILQFRNEAKKCDFTETLKSSDQTLNYKEFKNKAIELLKNIAEITKENLPDGNQLTLSIAIPFEDSRNNKTIMSFGIGDDVIYLNTNEFPIKPLQSETKAANGKIIGAKLFLPPRTDQTAKEYTYQIPFTITSFQPQSVLFAATDGAPKLINERVQAVRKAQRILNNESIELNKEDYNFLSEFTKARPILTGDICLDIAPGKMLETIFNDTVRVSNLYRIHMRSTEKAAANNALQKIIANNGLLRKHLETEYSTVKTIINNKDVFSSPDAKEREIDAAIDLINGFLEIIDINKKEAILKAHQLLQSTKDMNQDDRKKLEETILSLSSKDSDWDAIFNHIERLNLLYAKYNKPLSDSKNDANNDSNEIKLEPDSNKCHMHYSIGDDLVFLKLPLIKGLSRELREACWRYEYNEFLNDKIFWAPKSHFFKKLPALTMINKIAKRTESGNIYKDEEFKKTYGEWCKHRLLQAKARVKANDTDKTKVEIEDNSPELLISIHLTDVLRVSEASTLDKGDAKSATSSIRDRR